MSAPKDERPLPSVDDINAYLEQSAARTKKRLPLAFGTKGAPKAPARERKLRVAGPKPEGALEAVPAELPELLPELPAASSPASAPASSTPATKPSRS